MRFNTYCLVGGAGFIGSHFVDALLQQKDTQKVTVYDNFSSGREEFIHHHVKDPRFRCIRADVKDRDRLRKSMVNHEVVMHFAANPDIARAIQEPGIDFVEGFYLTHQVLEAARLTGVKRLLYTSGSGVYGEVKTESPEDQAGMYPISTYGASKLASEAFIASYCHLFDFSACVFRFANVVGPRQTHGIGFDFIRKLRQNPSSLSILGDGSQSKSYIHVSDVVQAVLLAHQRLEGKYEVYNVASDDYLSVSEIAQLAVACMDLKDIPFHYTGGDRGWKGDVPWVRLNTEKIHRLGWQCQYPSAEAIKASLLALKEDASWLFDDPISKTKI